MEYTGKDTSTIGRNSTKQRGANLRETPPSYIDTLSLASEETFWTRVQANFLVQLIPSQFQTRAQINIYHIASHFFPRSFAPRALSSLPMICWLGMALPDSYSCITCGFSFINCDTKGKI